MHWVLYRSRGRLECYDRDVLVASFRVGVGRRETPTPLGRWHLWVNSPAYDPARIAVLSTPRRICLRETDALETLGKPASSG